MCLVLTACTVYLGFVIVFPIAVGYHMVSAAGHGALWSLRGTGTTWTGLENFMENLTLTDIKVRVYGGGVGGGVTCGRGTVVCGFDHGLSDGCWNFNSTHLNSPHLTSTLT